MEGVALSCEFSNDCTLIVRSDSNCVFLDLVLISCNAAMKYIWEAFKNTIKKCSWEVQTLIIRSDRDFVLLDLALVTCNGLLHQSYRTLQSIFKSMRFAPLYHCNKTWLLDRLQWAVSLNTLNICCLLSFSFIPRRVIEHRHPAGEGLFHKWTQGEFSFSSRPAKNGLGEG